MYQIFRKLYLLIPFKRHFFQIVKVFYLPSPKTSGYLKFRGAFTFKPLEDISFKIQNDDSTLPTLLFWHGARGYEYLSLKVWASLSREGGTVLDLGANFGLFGLISLAANRNSQVVFFEPLKRNVQRIEKNLELNDFRATVETKAVSNEIGEIDFFDMDSNENTIGSIHRAFVLNHQHHKELVKITVPVVNLDHYIEEQNIEEISLIKIDVEGADYETLLGFQKYLVKFQPHILIEVTDGESAAKIQKLFSELPVKYHFYELNDEKGLVKTTQIDRENSGRNFLFSLADEQRLKSILD